MLLPALAHLSLAARSAVFPLLILISRSQPERLNTFPPCLAPTTIIKASMQHFIHVSARELFGLRTRADTIFWCKLSRRWWITPSRKSISWCGKIRARSEIVYIGEKRKELAAFWGLGAATTSVRLLTEEYTLRTLVSINKTNSSICMKDASVRCCGWTTRRKVQEVNFLCTFVPALRW